MLRQFIEAIKDLGPERRINGDSAAEVLEAKEAWLREWMSKLTSSEVPITPYRVLWEFMQTVNPSEAIITHDSGSPRDQLVPFYRATVPRSYIGWVNRTPLGTGLEPHYWRQARGAREILRQLHGRRGLWHDRARF